MNKIRNCYNLYRNFSECTDFVSFTIIDTCPMLLQAIYLRNTFSDVLLAVLKDIRDIKREQNNKLL